MNIGINKESTFHSTHTFPTCLSQLLMMGHNSFFCSLILILKKKLYINF